MLVCVWLTLIVGIHGVNTETHYGSLLYNDLFENYNPKVRPESDVDKPVDVNIYLDLVKILAVDEINQTFKITVNLLFEWLDKHLVWNVTDYGNIHKLVFPLDKNLWLPDLMNFNAAYKPGEFGLKYAFPNVIYNGVVFIWVRVNMETQCEIHTKKYPFDVQTCDIEFTTLGSSDAEIRLKTTQDSAELKYYVETAEWKITRNYVTNEVVIIDGYSYRTISYRFELKRTCTSCIVNTLLPIIILALLNLLSFFVPTESGEKLTFPMSVFLTLAVFLTIIMVSLPESVDGVSYLCTFVTFELGVSATTLLFTVITLRLHHEMGDTEIPHYAKLMVKLFRRSCITNSKKIQDSTRRDDNNADWQHEMISGKTDLNVNENSEDRNKDTSSGQVGSHINDIKWEHVSDAFDMMMFLILLVTQLIASAVFLIVMMI